jgi:hypothetical protein
VSRLDENNSGAGIFSVPQTVEMDKGQWSYAALAASINDFAWAWLDQRIRLSVNIQARDSATISETGGQNFSPQGDGAFVHALESRSLISYANPAKRICRRCDGFEIFCVVICIVLEDGLGLFR